MLFNSPSYIFLFLPVVAIVYFILNKKYPISWGHGWLVSVSFFFFGLSGPKNLIFITGLILLNFALGKALHRSKSISSYKKQIDHGNKFVLVAGIFLNVAILSYFKYYDFFVESINRTIGTNISLLNIALPLAISFYTFQQIAYLVDSYKNGSHEKNFLNYCLFVVFFPQLIAGPIVRYREMMPQFNKFETRFINWDNISKGLFVFSIGLFKKAIIADSFGKWAEIGFNSISTLTFFDAWGTSLSYTFQLYYDFSGYSDMAIGAGLLFNIVIPINFNSPYKAKNIQDFWHRWHITLSTWLRDYLYIPFGGNRKGAMRTYGNLIATFLIGGLWHGAGWTFVFWGFMHGVALAVHRFWKQLGFKMPKTVACFLTFMFINVAWVFFRAATFKDAANLIKAMAGLNGIQISKEFATLLNYLNPLPFMKVTGVEGKFLMPFSVCEHLLLFGLVAFVLPNSIQMIQFVDYQGKLAFKPNTIFAFLCALATYLSMMTFIGNTAPGDFLYFNF